MAEKAEKRGGSPPTSSRGSTNGRGDPVAMKLESNMQALFPLSREPKHLLEALEKLEKFLLGLDQTPSESTLKVLGSLMKALTTKELVNHHDMDVKVCVASCFSAVLRITAPDAPFGDGELKESLRLIVSAFADISNMSSYSFGRRVTILKTVSSVRSCLMMLDLECDALTMDMFVYFLRNIRQDHPDVVFSSMGMIMILILKEMSEVPMELLCTLLDHVRTKNLGILPVARVLVERVIEICARALAPHMPQAVQHRGYPLSDYSPIVSHVCDLSLVTGESRKSKGGLPPYRVPNTIKSKEVPSYRFLGAVSLQHTDDRGSATPVQVDPNQNRCHMLVENENQLTGSSSCPKEVVCGINVGENPLKNRTQETLKVRLDMANQMLSDTNLIGLNIKVWRKKYCRFQDAVIDSYNPETKKHKIVYANREVEMLVLQENRWKLRDGETTPNGDK